LLAEVFMNGSETQLRLLGQALGALGVILSLGFVAYEIRQNTAAVRSGTIQAISEQSFTSVAQPVENGELREALQAATTGDTLTVDQRFHLDIWYTGLLRIQQNRYMQTQLGTLGEEAALFIGGRGGAYALPAFQEYWEANRSGFPEEFAAWLEEFVIQVAP
jgi:hypothetical protein